MEITLSQKNALKLQAKSGVIVLNPTPEDKATVSLFTSQVDSASEKNGRVFTGPGEYEVQGSMIEGISLGTNNTAYSVVVEGLHVFYALGVTKTFTDAQLERIDGVDVLILNVDEDKAELMNGVISQIEPKVIVPLNEDEKELKVLAAEFGAEITPVEKCKVTKKELPEDSQQLVVLKKQ